MKFIAKLTLLIIPVMMLPLHLKADDTDLSRRASWEASFSKLKASGVEIKKINDSSALKANGLSAGDKIYEINGKPIATGEDWYDLTDALVVGKSYEISYQKQHEQQLKKVTLSFKPISRETHPKIDTYYESIVSDYGIRQRVIITKPKQSRPKKQPAMVILQGLSCSSIEKIPNRNNNYMRLIVDLVEKSGMVVMRTEKPGLGDSEGDCSKTDFKTELNGYEKAIQLLKSKDYVDTQKILVYGNSMGSALAPYMANKYDLAGVISDGTYMRTWFEHMLEIERRIREMQGDNQATITKKMNQAYIPLYYGMLIQKRSYQDLVTENPLLAEYNYHGLNHMYGRPMSFYHQLQDFDIAGEWEKLKVPVRIRWGTNDWIMSEYDNDLIMDLLKKIGHSDHKLYKYPGMDHWSTIHKDYVSSFTGKKGQWESNISQQVIDWAKEMVK